MISPSRSLGDRNLPQSRSSSTPRQQDSTARPRSILVRSANCSPIWLGSTVAMSSSPMGPASIVCGCAIPDLASRLRPSFRSTRISSHASRACYGSTVACWAERRGRCRVDGRLPRTGWRASTLFSARSIYASGAPPIARSPPGLGATTRPNCLRATGKCRLHAHLPCG